MKNKIIMAGLGLLLIAAAVGAGYRWGTARQPAPERGTTAVKQQAKILYYRNPMGLPDISSAPKKDAMGMDYIPVYEGEEPAGGRALLKISPDKVQKLGVKTEAATMRQLKRTVRAVATVQVDERRLHTVAPKFEGWVQKLYVNASGQQVARGQALMDIYSPELISAQQEYLIAWDGRQSLAAGSDEARAGMQQLAESALTRLRNWDISEEQIQRLQQEGTASRFLTLRSPATGVVLEKMVTQGMRVMPGEALYKIADLSEVWLLAEIFEQELGLIHQGQDAKITVSAYPDKVFAGKIAFIYPALSPETRTARVRIELPNPGGLLKPEMFASAELTVPAKAKALSVPDSAVIDSGTRQVVLVQRGEGLFEPRRVKLGMRADGYAEILEGLEDGENVVVSANFLIDAESSLKAALLSFKGQPAPAAPAPHAAVPAQGAH